MLVTIKSVFTGEFGTLGWMFIGGYAAAAIVVTFALIGAMALVKRIWRANGARLDRQ
jgi:hypothetical protein